MRIPVVPLVAISLIAAACGGSSETPDASASITNPAATETAVTEPVVAEPPITEPPATEPVVTEPPITEPVLVAGWTEFVPTSEECACSDGSEFRLFDRPADPTKVMFYFEGGGACFTTETCDPNGEPTYSPTITQTTEGLSERRGLFDTTNSLNPLADYSIVYVPYCTGDVHIGRATTEYSPEVTIEHRGSPNALAALDYLVATYPNAERVVVTGASAGSVPTPLMAGLVGDRLTDADIITFGDSSAAYPDVPAVNEAIGTLWGTTNAIPDWDVNVGLTPAEWSIPGLYTQAGTHDPDITFGRFDYAFDSVQATFGALAGVAADDLVTLTWNSKPNETYTIKFSIDMTNWDTDIEDSVAADPGDSTTASFDLKLTPSIVDAEAVFFRVERNPG